MLDRIHLREIDWVLIGLLLINSAIGLVLIQSASVFLHGGFAVKQAVWILAGLVLLMLLLTVDYKVLMGLVPYVYAVLLAVLLVITSYLKARGVLFESIFIGITSWPWAARAIRAQTFSLRSRDFIDLAKLSGRRGWKIILNEIAPNMSSYLFLTFILLFGGAILIAASLDFIGLGPTGGMSLGLMLFDAVTYGAALLLGIWWWFIPPGVGIVALVGALYVMNVGLDEIFNPKLREM